MIKNREGPGRIDERELSRRLFKTNRPNSYAGAGAALVKEPKPRIPSRTYPIWKKDPNKNVLLIKVPPSCSRVVLAPGFPDIRAG